MYYETLNRNVLCTDNKTRNNLHKEQEKCQKLFSNLKRHRQMKLS